MRHASAGGCGFAGAQKGAVPTVPTWGRVTVTGRLSIAGVYEWDDFGLTESRADWLVQAAVAADRGDTMLDLVLLHNG
jgi:hypothetical protein